MDVALLVFAVLGLVMGCVGIIYSFFAIAASRKEMSQAISRLVAVNAQFDARNLEMSGASASLSALHNDQVAKLKAIGERLETLELRFHGVTPQAPRRTY